MLTDAEHASRPVRSSHGGGPCDSRAVLPRRSSRRRFRAGVLGALSSGPLHRAQISFAAMWAGESAFMVSLAVVAYGEGGVTAVGVVTAARMATAALLAPFLATLADRVRRERVLTCVGVVRGAMLACAAAVTASGGPAAATYAFAIVATVAVALYRPAHSALLPALAKSPEDLTSANAVRGMLDSLSTLGGPVVAAVLLAASGPATAFAACAAASLLGGLVVVALPYDEPPRADAVRGSAGRDVVQGFATIAGDRTLSLVTALGVVQTLTRGCLTVFTVVLAIDLLDTGDPGVGVLNAAVGAGGVLGSLFAFTLVRRGGLARWFGVGIALFGAPLALIGAVPEQAAAIVLLGLVGVGNALIDVGGFTILARMTDEAVLARMFAGFEAILTLGVRARRPARSGPHRGARPARRARRRRPPGARRRGRELDHAAPARRPDAHPRRGHRDPARGPDARRPPGGDHRAARRRARPCRVRARADGLRTGRCGGPVLRGRVRSCGRGPQRTRHQHARARRGVRRDRPARRRGRARPPSSRPGAKPLCVGVLQRPAFLTAVTGYPMSATASREVVTLLTTRDAAAEEVSRPTP